MLAPEETSPIRTCVQLYVRTYVQPPTYLEWPEHVGVCGGRFTREDLPESQGGLAQLVKALEPLRRSLPRLPDELQHKMTQQE